MNINDVYRVKIIDEDINGNGVCKIDNLVVFVKNALLDEELEIKIIEVNKHFASAIINKILVPSKERIASPCPYYDKCGGCNFLHTSYLNERKIKKTNIEKLYNLNVDYLNTNNVYNYRNKVTLHVKDNFLGYYNEKTHEICKIDECLLLNDKINDLIKVLNTKNISSIDEVMIRCVDDKIMVNIIGNITDINLDVDSLYINNIYVKGEKYLIDNVNGIKYSIYPTAFYQVNNEGMISIYNKVKEYLNNVNSLLDLYCGTGTIGIWVHDKYKKALGIEVNSSSIDNANINKKLNSINNIEFICDDAKNINGKYDTIVIDPPRSGLSKNVINFLNSQESKIIYVSCNPKTLKRNIDLLNNFKVINISICDMFPRTKHVESVVLLERR